MTVPSLTGLQPLLLLVEIGSEKLLRDYSSFLIGKDFVTAHDLEYYLSDKPSPPPGGAIEKKAQETESLIDVERRLVNLKKLHQCMELVLTVNQTFKLPSLTLAAAARQVLRYYEKEKITDNHMFNIPVQTSAVSSTLKRVGCVSKWQLHSINKTGEESMYLITPEPPLPHTGHVITGVQEGEPAQHLYLTVVEQLKCSL